MDGWILARAPASPAQGLHHHGPRYFNFPYFCTMCGLEKLGLVDQNWLERNLSALLLRTLVVGRRQQSQMSGRYILTLCVFCGICFGYTDVHYFSYARVGVCINALSKFLFSEWGVHHKVTYLRRGLHFCVEMLHRLISVVLTLLGLHVCLLIISLIIFFLIFLFSPV